MKAADYQAQYGKRDKAPTAHAKAKAVLDTKDGEKVQQSQAVEAEKPSKSMAMDKQREAFLADLLERLFPMGEVNHISNNVLEFTRGKYTYQITVKLK